MARASTKSGSRVALVCGRLAPEFQHVRTVVHVAHRKLPDPPRRFALAGKWQPISASTTRATTTARATHSRFVYVNHNVDQDRLHNEDYRRCTPRPCDRASRLDSLNVLKRDVISKPVLTFTSCRFLLQSREWIHSHKLYKLVDHIGDCKKRKMTGICPKTRNATTPDQHFDPPITCWSTMSKLSRHAAVEKME